MKRLYKPICILFGLLLIVFSGNIFIKAETTARPEVRAIWVDAFHDGAKTPEQVDKLIQDCLKANINTVLVQVRRRGDAYYNQSIEPRSEDPVLPAGFDALQYLIDKAHANHIEVHAWLNTLVAWISSTPPNDPNHVWNLHGPNASESDTWVSFYRKYDETEKKWSEQLFSSYFLDPGNPDVVDYTANVYLNIVKHYNVDGIHLDYSRYAGTQYGYNPTSVARYNARYGTTGLPDPADPQWAEWRREQTANLVRKIYLKAIAVKPGIKVSSAVITWGDGPVSADDWEKSRAYQQVFQDWEAWLREGIIDMVMPMNYFSAWNSKHQIWYHHWIEWEKNHQYERQIVIGPGIFMQYPEQSLEQIRGAQGPSADGKYAAGVCLYSYGESQLYGSDSYKEPGSGKGFPRQPHVYLPESNSWIFTMLSQESGYQEPVWNAYISTLPVFPTPAAVPEMPWKSHPTKGYLMGTVTDSNGKLRDHLKIVARLLDVGGTQIEREAYTDGSGWYGLTELPPGLYYVEAAEEAVTGSKPAMVSIGPGLVSEANLQTVTVENKVEEQKPENPETANLETEK